MKLFDDQTVYSAVERLAQAVLNHPAKGAK
jgi:hypothetical protein